MRKLVSPLTFLFFLSLIIPCQSFSDKKEDKYKEWLQKDAYLLLSEAEVKEFKALKSDEEKDMFIKLFWAKRDPTPSSEGNEFKEEWYKRLEYAEENYKSGPIKGIRSDMGKVYMYFGPPAQIKVEAGGIRDDPSGGSQMEVPPQIWIYQAMPDLGMNQPFSVTFRQYQFGYELDQQTSQQVRRAMEIFPKIVQFNADLQELPKYRFRLDESSFEGKLINDFIISGEEIEQVPIQWAPNFTQATNESTYIYFIAQIDTNAAGLKKDEEFTFFGMMKGESGETAEFLKTFHPEKTKVDKVVVGFGLPLFPGNYTLYLGVRNKNKEKLSLLKAPLEVPSFGTDDLKLSTIILSPKVEQIKKKEKEDEEYNPYVFGQMEATPRLGNVFKSSENLSIIFQIYNAKSVNEEISLHIEYFIEAPEGTYRLIAQDFNEKVEAGKAITGGTEIPLSPLKPGNYTLKIKVVDPNAVKVAESKIAFTVE